MWLPSNSRTDDAPRVPAVATPVQTYSVSDPVRTTKAPLAEPWSCQPVLEPAGQVISQMSAPAPVPDAGPGALRDGQVDVRERVVGGEVLGQRGAGGLSSVGRAARRATGRARRSREPGWEVGKVAVMVSS